jgi:CheY-specific phosphatase CheX
MIQNDHALIAEVAQSVLETMVFAMSERSDSYPDGPLENCLFAEISYSGSRNGELSIIAPKPLCREWAEMMAGEDAADLVLDVLGEVTNIIGGNWLSRSFTGNENIRLNPPKVVVANSHHWDRVTREESTVVLSVEDNPFILNVNARD